MFRSCVAPWLLITALSLSGYSGCYTSLGEPKPEPPSGTEEIVGAYENPGVPLTEETAPEIESALDQRFELLEAVCGWSNANDVAFECDGLGPLFAAINALAQAGFFSTIPSDEPQQPVEGLTI